MQRRTLLRIGLLIGVLLSVFLALVLTRFLASAQGTRIWYGETLTGNITTAEDQDVWLFDGVSGDVIVVRIERASGDLIPSVTLEDSQGALLISLDGPEEGPPTVLFTTSLRTTGTHTLTVQAHGGTTGTYTVNLELQSAGSQTGTQAGVLTYGEVGQGEITNTTFRQYWSFRGAQGDVIDATMTTTLGNLDGYLSLITPEGNVLTTADSGGSGLNPALLAVKLPLNGTYTLVARRAGSSLGEEGNTQGNYTLALTLRTPGSSQESITPAALALGTETHGVLTADAPAALYSVEAKGVLAFSLDMDEPLQVGTITVMTTEQALLKTVSGTAPLRSSVPLPASGTVWIEVSALDIREGNPVDFLFTIDLIGTATRTSHPLLYGEPQTVAAHTASEPDDWHFAGQQGDLVEITVSPYGPVTSGSVRIKDPGGSTLVRRSAQSGFSQALALGRGGLYEVSIDPEAASAGYQIGIERKGVSGRAFDQRSEAQERGVLLPGSENAVSGQLGQNGSDAWLVDASEAQVWGFTLNQTDASFPLALAVEAPDGRCLKVMVTGQLANWLQVELPSAGRYRAVVFDPTGNANSAYTLQGDLLEGGSLSLNRPAKGELTSSAIGDLWTVDVPPDALLTIQLETITEGGGIPAIYVLGPDGLLVASSLQDERQNPGSLTGIFTSAGGLFRVIVEQPGLDRRLVYKLTANVRAPFGTEINTAGQESLPVSEVFAVEATPTPRSNRVVIADQITESVGLDTAAFESAQTLQFSTLTRGKTAPGAPYQVWRLSTEKDQTLEISVIALDESSTPDIMLLDQSGGTLAENFQSDSVTNDLMYRVPAAGSYYVVVRLDQSGPYTLWAEALSDLDEQIPSVLSGQSIIHGETVAGELIGPDDTHSYAFYGHPNDTIMAKVICTQGDLGPHLALQTTDGTLLSEAVANTSCTADLGEISLPYEGIYRLVVNAGSGTGRFALHLDLRSASESVEHGGGVLNDQQVAGLNLGDSVHHWLFDAQSGEQVTIRVEPLDDLAPLEIQVADTAGHVFLQKETRLGQGALQFSQVLLPRTGVYQVIVSGGLRQSGFYRLSLSRDLTYTYDTERTVYYGQTVGKVLTQQNYLDVWTMAGSRGDVVAIAARAVRGDPAQISFQLRDSGGQVLATAVDDGSLAGVRLEGFTLPTSGHYSIVVGNPDPSFAGEVAYELTVLLENTPARSMGTTITYGQKAEGVFYVDDPVDTWLFEGQQGDLVTVTAEGLSPGLLPTLSLISTDWHTAEVAGRAEVLASAQAVEGQPAQIAQYMLFVSGSYALQVEDTTRTGGTYRLELAGQTSLIGSSPIALGETQSGSISSAVLTNAWTFTGTQNVPVTITVTPDSRSSLSSAVSLWSPSGAVIAAAEANTGQAAAIQNYQLPSSGLFTVVVSRRLGNNGRTEGLYDLKIQQATSPTADQRSTSYGMYERGVISLDTPAAHWVFEGQSGDVVRIQAEATSGNLDPTLRLYGPDGGLLDSGDDEQGLDAEIIATLAADGLYEIEVARYEGKFGTTTGNYGLSVERVYRFAPVAPESLLVYGDRISGTTDSQNRSAYWTFSGVQDDMIFAKLQFPKDDAPLTLLLSDPAGNTLATGVRSGGDSVIEEFELPVSGFYTLEVRRPGDARADTYSPYTLELQFLSSSSQMPTQGGVLSLGQTVTGQFAVVPATHNWIFQGKAGESVSITLNRLTGTLAARLVLLAPDGSSLLVEDPQPGAVNVLSAQAVRLPLDGLYLLQVIGDESALGMTYRLFLQPASLVEPADQTLTTAQDGFGTINNAQPSQTWTFAAEAGTSLSLRAGAVSGDLAPTLTLWGSDGRPLIEGVQEQTPDGLQASLAQFVVPETASYQVTVSRTGGSGGNTAGSYRLMLREQTISALAVTAADVAFGERTLAIMQGAEPQVYAFQGLAGDVVSISVRRMNAGVAPTLSLETESGSAIDAPAMYSKDETAVPAFVLPEEGRYLILVQGEETVEYALVVLRRESAISSGAATRSLGLGADFLEGITDPTRSTQWLFSGTAGEVLTFTVDTSGGDLRADMTLYGPEGYIGSATEQSGSRVTTLGPVRLPDSGNYILLIRPWLGKIGGSTGQYTVRVDSAPPGVSGSVGGRISAYGQWVTGGLIPEDNQDTWTFDGQAGEVVTVRAEQTQEGGPLTLAVIGSDGVQLANGQAGTAYQGVEITSLMLPSSGTYTVKIGSAPDGVLPVEYRLSVTQIQTPIAASMNVAHGIAYGDVQSGMIAAQDQYQAWVFYGQGGERITAEIQATGSISVPALYLIDRTGQVLYAAVSSATGSVRQLPEIVLPERGFYGLVVGRNPAEQAAGAIEYTVSVKRLDAGAVSQGVLNSEATSQLTLSAPVHEWTLSPAVSGDYLVQVVPLAPEMRLDLFVLKADDAIIAAGAPDDQGSIKAVTKLTGGEFYTAVVSGGVHQSQGQYRIRFSPASLVTNGGMLTGGEPNVGQIDALHFTDEWIVQAQVSGTLGIEVDRTGGDLIPLVSLFDENGILIREEAAGGDGVCRLNIDLPAAGRYRILVSRVGNGSGSTSGDYAITVNTP